MKPVIIAIVGAAGSGKTHMSLFLQDKLNIPTIVSYTTRPIRKGETDGIEHYFVKPDSMPNKSEMLAYTFYGGHHYFALHKQIPNGICSYVIDEAGIIELVKDHADKYQIICVYVNSSNDAILARGVCKSRIARDITRKKLDPDFYDCVINNNGSIEDFEQEILRQIN